MEAELRHNGCDTRNAGSTGFADMTSEMGDPGAEAPSQEVTIVPGRPTIDPNAR